MLAVNVLRQPRSDNNLTCTVFIRFASHEVCEAFCDEFDGTLCAGRRLECGEAHKDSVIPPRSQWDGQLMLNRPRFKEQCWSFPTEDYREGVEFVERPRPRQQP